MFYTRFKTIIALHVCAGVIGVTWLILRLPFTSALAWIMITVAIVLEAIANGMSRKDEKRHQRESESWHQTVRELVGDADYNAVLDRDPHFGEFAPEELSLIVDLLRTLPPERRNLETAMAESGVLDLNPS